MARLDRDRRRHRRRARERSSSPTRSTRGSSLGCTAASAARPPRNEGEAHLLAVCKRTPGWLAITEDKQGWEAARDERIGRDYLVTALAAAAAQDRLNPTEAWKLHVEIEQWRQRKSHHGIRFSVMPYYSDYRPVFQQVVRSFRKEWINAGRPEWCQLLATPGLDDALILAIRRAR